MGSVNLTNLKNVNKEKTGFTYVDLHLDIEESKTFTDSKSTSLGKSDLRVSYDEAAIKNSLINKL